MNDATTTTTDVSADDQIDDTENIDPRGSLRKSNMNSDAEVYTEDGKIVATDDGLYGAVARAQKKTRDSSNDLWSLLTPLSYGHVDLRKNVEVYHTDREVYLKAERILIDDDGLPGFVFQVAPRDFSGESEELLRVWGDQFAEWVENGTIKTKQEVSDELMDMMENL